MGECTGERERKEKKLGTSNSSERSAKLRSMRRQGRKKNSGCDAGHIFRFENHSAFSNHVDGSVGLTASLFHWDT